MSKTISGIPWGSSGEATSISGGAAGQVVYQNGSSSTAFTNAADGVLQSDGTTPVFSALSLSGTRVIGTLPLTKGGTGVTTLTGITGSSTGKIVTDGTPTLITPILGAATGTSLQLSGLTASSALATDGSKNLVSVTNNGTGNNVLTSNAALIAPDIGNAQGANLTLSALTANATFLRSNNTKQITSIVAPKLIAYLGSNQAVSGATTLNIDTVIIDTTSAFNTSTHRYTPLVAGYYAASMHTETTAVSAIVQVTVLKNGGDIAAVGGTRSGAGAGTFATTCSGFIDMNGTTDYLEFICYGASATTALSGYNSTCVQVYMIP